MVMRLTRPPLPGRRTAAFDEFVGLALLDVLVAEEPVVVGLGGTVCGVVNVMSNEGGRDTEGGAGVTAEGRRGEDRKRAYR